jgi:hypothetical protein
MPPGPFGSGIQVTTLSPADLTGANFSAVDCIFLCDPDRISESAAATVQAFVRAGGGLVVFAGPDVDAPAANRLLFEQSVKLLPAPLGTPIQLPPDKAVPMRQVGDSPITAMFAPGLEGTQSARFSGFVQTSAVEAPSSAATSTSATEVLARFADAAGTPAVLRRQVGQGYVYLVTTTADLRWNDWARASDGSFVVTLLELVQYSSAAVTDRNMLAGQPLTAGLDPTVSEPHVEFIPPGDAAPIMAQAVDSPSPGQILTVLGPQARQTGVWRIIQRQRDGAQVSRPFAVNMDPAESDLSIAAPARLDRALAGVPHRFISASDAYLPSGESARVELWRWIAAALFVLLLLEQFLAWWFGRVSAAIRAKTGFWKSSRPAGTAGLSPPAPLPAPRSPSRQMQETR